MKTKPADLINENEAGAEVLVGQKLRELRMNQGLSLRALAELSGLNVNTLSLVENGKSSPSVSTLQQMAQALKIPIAAFFETEPEEQKVIFTPANLRPLSNFGSTRLENLGKDFVGNRVQPFIIVLQPGIGSGDREIVHTGYEFVFCLDGCIRYQVEEEEFYLNPGDSLLFEAHLPHTWENCEDEATRVLLIMYPTDVRDEPSERHFSLEALKKEINMKVAAITDDGQTISQHFGRAPYYLVLTIEEGKVVQREMREKMGHTHFSEQHSAESASNEGSGMDADSHNKHVSMSNAIADCKALLCGGMGMGAYESMRQLNIQPIVTDISNIDEAVQAFIDGKLVDHTELLH